MSSTSSSSFDHHRNQSVQLVTAGSSASSKSSSCSSVSSHRSDDQIYSRSSLVPTTSNGSTPSTAQIPSSTTVPLLYLNPFSHLLQSSCSSNQSQLALASTDERCPSVSPSSTVLPESQRCSPSNSIPLPNSSEEDENTKPKIVNKPRPCSR